MFYLVAAPFLLLFAWGLIRLGRRCRLDSGGGSRPKLAPGRLLRLGVLQRRLWRNPGVGAIHAAISIGFGILLLGSVVILVDAHVLAPLGRSLPGGSVYASFQALLDVFGLVFVAGVAVALVRGLAPGPTRQDRSPMAWVLLGTLLFLGSSGFLLEALRLTVDGDPIGGGRGAGAFAGRALASVLGLGALPAARDAALYRSLWWVHGAVALVLVAAIPYTRLRHLLTAPANLLVSDEAPRPTPRLPFDLREILAGGALDVRVGVSSTNDLGWRERLALGSCTDCGRCDLVCPAVRCGSALSPRALVRTLWDACDGGDAETSEILLESIVSGDEVWACTLCGACSLACPVLVRPAEGIVEMRRELVTRGRMPSGASQRLANLARCGNPYGTPHRERERLGASLGAPTPEEEPDFELLYWVGCASTYDSRTWEVAAAMTRLLRRAEVRFAVLGSEERCCGEPARRLGEEGRFQELALQNIAAIERSRATRLVTHCAHCFDTLRNDYPALGAEFEVVHHTELIDGLLRDGRLDPTLAVRLRATVHDACGACRFNGVTAEPRRVLEAVPALEMVEMPRNRENALCCGGGGGSYWYDAPRRESLGELRLDEAVATGAEMVVVECPFCLKELESAAMRRASAGSVQVRDVAEVVALSLNGSVMSEEEDPCRSSSVPS